MTGKERTLRAIEFRNPDRIPLCVSIDRDNAFNAAAAEELSVDSTSDMVIVHNGDSDFRPGTEGEDEWGCVWKTTGYTFGEVAVNPLADWTSWDEWLARVPDWSLPRRYDAARAARAAHPDKFIMGGLSFMMMHLIDFRGYENFMTDFYLEPEKLRALIEVIDREAYKAVAAYGALGLDAVIVWEDWGLQESLMISPELWRRFFKNRMARLIAEVHRRGMKFIFHCCGYIIDIIDDLIEVGVDVLQLDQQRSMGLERLSSWKGRVCFFCPGDIQFTSCNTDAGTVEAYCRSLAEALAAPSGGFMYKIYSQPKAVEIPLEALRAELRTFSSYNPYARRNADAQV